MDLGIKDKTALVISSTEGLGFGCAKALAAEGVHVVINGRSKEKGIEAVDKLGGDAHFVQADVSRSAERDKLFQEAEKYLGTISILVTNINSPSPGTFMSKTLEEWRTAFELLMISALDMINKCLPGMIEQGYGRIINISSTSAKEILPGYTFSNSLKPGLIGALGTLAREAASSGVTINSILPGPFDTGMMRRHAHRTIGRDDITPEDAVRLMEKKELMERWGSIEEFGALCAFLSSQHAGYITGQSIVIDGGKVPALM